VTLPFEQLDFLYIPSRDVAAERDEFVDRLAAREVFAIESHGTRVAMVELSEQPPSLLLAGHLAGERPLLVYRVASLGDALDELERRDWRREPTFEIPHGPCCSFELPGGHRIAVYEAVRPGATRHFAGRHDF
jgi:hypothetical protein